MAKKLNILMLMTDQHNPNLMGPENRYGVETPHIDRLASQSVVFDQAYCNSPICVPSRMSLMTGQYPHHHRVYDNGGSLHEAMPTFAHGLTLAGYETVICARMHFNGMEQHHGFEKRLMSEFCNPVEYPPPSLEWDGPLDPKYGGVDRRDIEHRVSDSRTLRYDDDIADRACAYLKARSWGGRPFFLLASFYGPHPCMAGRKEYLPLYEKYFARDLHVRELDQEEFEALPAHIRRLICRDKAKAKVMSREAIQEYRAEYLARVTYTDGLVGQVLDTLEAEGLAEETIIIYLSDHGDQMGEHGIVGKSNFYDDTARVPLMIALPCREAKSVQADVQLVDVLPTLFDLAGVPKPGYALDGHSLMPLVEDANAAWSYPAFSAFFDASAMRPNFMLKQGAWKYVFYPGEPCFLYNLEDDPGERVNRAVDPECQAVLARMHASMLEICDPAVVEEEALHQQAQRRFAILATASSRVTKERLQKRIADYRAAWDEAYWDGNKKQSVHEAFLDADLEIDPANPRAPGQRI